MAREMKTNNQTTIRNEIGGSIVGTLPPDSQIRQISKTGKWSLVEIGTLKGYVNSSFLEPVGEKHDAPAAQVAETERQKPQQPDMKQHRDKHGK